MTPEKAIAVLEGKIPHRDQPGHNFDQKEPAIPRKIQSKEIENKKDLSNIKVTNNHDFLKTLAIMVIVGILGVSYLSIVTAKLGKYYKIGFHEGEVAVNSKLTLSQKDIINKDQQIKSMRQDLENSKRSAIQLQQVIFKLRQNLTPLPKRNDSLVRPLIQTQDQKGFNPIHEYNKAIQLNPNDINAYINRGLAFEDNKVYDKAIMDFDKALEIAPDLVQAYTARGSAYEAEGNYNKAIADFSQAIKISPHYALCFYRRGDVYYLKGNVAQAISNWNKAIKLDSNNASSRISYYREGNHDKDISENTNVIKVYPDYFQAFYRRGAAYAAKGDHNRAITDFSRVIELNPKYIDAYNNRAVAYFFKQEYSKAWKDVRKVLELGGAVNVDFINSLKTAASDKDKQF